MAIYGIAINKSLAFRSSSQPTSNVYFVSTNLAASRAVLEPLVDAIVAMEKEIHANNINFVSARVWTAGGSAADNETVFIKDLAGQGSQARWGDMDVERAVLVQWDAGRSQVTGRKVYLRKWYHVCTDGPSGAGGSDVLAQQATLSQGFRDFIEEAVSEVFDNTPFDNVALSSQSGREVVGPPICYPWLEHHQLGDQWR